MTDLVQGQVIELWPGRDGSALLAGLKEQPQIEVVSRDRWAPFAQAVAEALPQAMQVADRWHLLKNPREAVERFFQRRYGSIKETLQASTPAEPITTPSNQPREEDSSARLSPEPGSLPASLSPRNQAKQARRQRRIEGYQIGRAVLADGSVRQFDSDAAEVEWNRGWRPVLVSAVGDEVLVGIRL